MSDENMTATNYVESVRASLEANKEFAIVTKEELSALIEEFSEISLLNQRLLHKLQRISMRLTEKDQANQTR